MLAAVVFHEYVGRRVAAGTVLVIASGAVLTWSAAPQLRLGAILVAGACLCWAVDNGIAASLDELAPHHITMAKGVVAGSANLVLGLLVAAPPSLGQGVSALVIGAFGYGLSITLWVRGARDLGAARGQLIFAVPPFVAVIAWVVLGEPVTAAQLVALGFAVAGVSAVMKSAHLHDHEHVSQEHEHEHVHDDSHHDHEHVDSGERHVHPHRHRELIHAHPHVPDLHHRHAHA